MKTKAIAMLLLLGLLHGITAAGEREAAAPTPGEITAHMIPLPHDFHVRGWRVHYALLDHQEFPAPTTATLIHWTVTATREGKTVTYLGGVLYGLFNINTGQGIHLRPIYNVFVDQLTE